MNWRLFLLHPFIDWFCIFLSLLMLAGYEIYLFLVGNTAPYRIAQRTHAHIRSAWIKKMQQRNEAEVVVVQTIRNSLMAASFMASTAMLALIGLLTISGLGAVGNMLNLNSLSALAAHVSEFKQILLALVFFASFFFNTMAVRFYMHATYVISLAVGSTDDQQSAMALAYLNCAGSQFSMGTRAFFFSLPVFVGLFNSWLMLPTTLVLIFLLYRFDRMPVLEKNGNDQDNTN